MLVTVCSGGIGLLLNRVSALRLGALCVPAGFAAGICIVTFSLQLGLPAWMASACAATAAVAGYAFMIADRNEGDEEAGGERAPRSLRKWMWPSLAGLAAFSVGMAPLIGTGRLGVLGYVMLNDPAWHISLVEWMSSHGAAAASSPDSSFAYVSTQISQGYPLGSYAWPLFAITFTGIEGLFIWTPLIALTLAMTALVAFSLLRRSGANSVVAAVAGSAVGVGYLPLSYLAQGGAKEVLFAFTLLTATALMFAPVDEHISTPKELIRSRAPAAIALASMAYVFGPGAAIWAIPLVGFAFVQGLVRPPAAVGRLGILLAATAALGIAAVVALPAILKAYQLLDTVKAVSEDASQNGNLLGPVPKREVFNAWIAHDYRFDTPYPPLAGLSRLATLVALLLAGLGLVREATARRPTIPVAVAVGAIAIFVIERKFNLYFLAKSLVAIAPAVGLTTAAGVVWLLKGNRAFRIAAVACGSLILLSILLSSALLYTSVFMTPKQRFDELGSINQRLTGKGPILVVEREEYARLLLRDVKPWESYGLLTPDRGFRAEGSGPVTHTPDIDDFNDEFMRKFEFLLVRKRPGGSAPPSNFTRYFETKHYEIWRRSSPSPALHIPLGRAKFNGKSKLRCSSTEYRDAMAAVQNHGGTLKIAGGGDARELPVTEMTQVPGPWSPLFDQRFEAREKPNQTAVAMPHLKSGRHFDVFIQGTFGHGVTVTVDGAELGFVYGDRGIQNQWFDLGDVLATGRNVFAVAEHPRPFWVAGASRDDLIGALAFVDRDNTRWIKTIPASRLSNYCGRELDWIEVAN